MKRIYLYYIAAALWGIPGVILTLKGLRAYFTMPQDKLWWLILITALVLAGFFFMFSRIVDRYSARIAALPEIPENVARGIYEYLHGNGEQ